ncbi:class I SAM-dependent methyltransferase [Fontisphaera persica]|uniref:class I SAM-dependent methyltransferase n=1 Tax=Fontisphaera persica TaxID=2974023 RepID=UPI0024C0DB80|nr:class I SAM-dependent methyltransferase [Fontisphaera persica]WCJ60858.1 class I SAM-dependent methyltransferase [Fontisphaera persica]
MSDNADHLSTRWHGLRAALAGLNGYVLLLRWLKPDLYRACLSENIRRGEEYLGWGLPPRDPIDFLWKNRPSSLSREDRVHLPPRLTDAGGTSLTELTMLAAATRLLQPRCVFEIGTFNGRTTAVFLMNTPPEARVYSLDLPPSATPTEKNMIDSDCSLIQRRRLAAYVYEYGLEARFEQLLGDSLAFDPSPFAGRVELGFIDGAHALPYVRNDTEKMARMIAPAGLVFWHDYGGRGRFGPLTAYLESLQERLALYRVPGTTLAWTQGSELRKLLPD